MSAIQGKKDGQRTIRSDAEICRGLFLDAISRYTEHDVISHGIKREIQDEFGRFNLWTAVNYVFAPVLASLDYRIVDSPAFKDQLLIQLAALRSRLGECRSRLHVELFSTSI